MCMRQNITLCGVVYIWYIGCMTSDISDFTKERHNMENMCKLYHSIPVIPHIIAFCYCLVALVDLGPRSEVP